MSEKWNYNQRINVQGDIDADLQDTIVGESHFGDMAEVSELTMTEQEKKIIYRIQDAVDMFTDQLKLSRLSIDIDRIHILTPEEYSALPFDTPGVACMVDGHTYVQRNNDSTEMVSDLTHEIAHEISFLKKRVDLNLQEDEIHLTTHELRRGFGSRSGSKEEMVGRGFNEAMTEIVAQNIRVLYSQDDEAMGENERDWLIEAPHAYWPQQIVMNKVFEVLEPGNPEQAAADTIHDFFTGHPKTFKDIQKKFADRGIKGGLKILMAMGTSADSALETAKKLDLPEAVREIGEWQERSNESET